MTVVSSAVHIVVLDSVASAELRLFLVWCMWPLDVAIDGGRCLLISSIVKFGHVAK